MLPRIIAISAISAAACFAQISLERPAAVGFPVWLKIPATDPVETSYPFAPGLPAGFGCKQVELRRNGKTLPEIPGLVDQSTTAGLMGASGNPCGSVVFPSTSSSHLPLHLRYHFDQPGVYEIRFTAKLSQYAYPPAPTEWTEWTPIEISPGSPELRANWLKEVGAHAPTDPVALLTDYLPSILGVPDDKSLEMLSPYLYHPDLRVRRYAAAALTYWPVIPIEAAVKQLLQTKGPSDAIIRFLARGRYEALPDFDFILDIVLPYLGCDDPVLIAGALEAVGHLSGAASIATPEHRLRAEREFWNAQEHIHAVGDAATVQRYDSMRSYVHIP